MTTTDEQVVDLPAVPDSLGLPLDPLLGGQVDEQEKSVVDTPPAEDSVDVSAAGAEWVRSVAAGRPSTGRELGERFEQPEQWGWDRIAEVVSAQQDQREFARGMWRASMDAGQALTGRELGEWCRRSERWGRDRIAEARQPDADGAAATTPARRRRATKPDSGTPDAAPGGINAPSGRHTAELGIASTAGAVEPLPPNTPAPVLDVLTAEPAAATATGVPVPSGARLVAWAGFLFGTAISVAANVLYAWLPTLAGKAGPPGLAPQVGAAVWPIALVISVEVLSRVAWRPGWAWQLARYGGAGVVALGAAVISYGHLSGVLTYWGYGTTGAAVGPLVVDGLMTISGFALLAMSHSDTNGNGTSGKAARR